MKVCLVRRTGDSIKLESIPRLVRIISTISSISRYASSLRALMLWNGPARTRGDAITLPISGQASEYIPVVTTGRTSRSVPSRDSKNDHRVSFLVKRIFACECLCTDGSQVKQEISEPLFLSRGTSYYLEHHHSQRVHVRLFRQFLC